MVFLTYIRAILGLVFSAFQTAIISLIVFLFASLGQLRVANRMIRL